MTIEQTAIWDYLVTNALGSNNAKQMKVIASAIGVPSTGTNSDNIRSFINDMVINHNKPIGTSLSGAFIILNE